MNVFSFFFFFQEEDLDWDAHDGEINIRLITKVWIFKILVVECEADYMMAIT